MDNNNSASSADEIARLKRMLADPCKKHMTDILRRRLFAIDNEIAFANPFPIIDGFDMECLYGLGARQ